MTENGLFVLGGPETQLHEDEKPTEEKPQEQKAEKTPEEKRKAFGELVRDGGEYSDIFNEVMQQAIIKAGEAVHADPKAAALRQALSEAYGDLFRIATHSISRTAPSQGATIHR